MDHRQRRRQFGRGEMTAMQTALRLASLFVFACMACARLAHGADEAQPPKDLAELQKRIEGILEKTHTPAIGIALVNRDGPYWVAGLGKANLKSGKPADENTLFRIGSISKMFAALAVLKLVEEGKLSLDDTVHARAPEVAFENPWEATHPVRIAHLLEHTTGWDDIHIPEYAYAAPDSVTIREGLAYHPHSRVSRWIPGTRHAYSNSGAAVAAYIVEKVTGQRYEDYVASTFFAPLGMTSTSYFKTREYDERGATLYLGNEPQEYWQILHRPAGSINSSASDMAHLVHLLLLRGATPATRLLSEASIDRMELPATTLGAAAGITGGYGLANYTSGYKNYNFAFHGHNGGVIGGLSVLAYVKELGEGYVFFINSGNGGAMGQISELVQRYLLRNAHAPEPVNADLPEAFKELTGYYLPINPRQQGMRFLAGMTSILKVSNDEKFLHREPLFGGWLSSDRVASSSSLIDAWHGLPAIAVVTDPLAGPALQVNSDLLQRVPAWSVFARFIVPGLMIVMTLIGFVALIVWVVRRLRKTSTDRRLALRLLPIIATAVLIGFLISIAAAGAFLMQASTISPFSIAVLVLSLGYPALVLLGAFQLLKSREHRNLTWWFAASFVLVHLLIAGYLAAYGVIGVRTWA
jgi:CubicO group peptidase (beta-lactamase class C family)